jgi:hypothetical protein
VGEREREMGIKMILQAATGSEHNTNIKWQSLLMNVTLKASNDNSLSLSFFAEQDEVR